jgi:creatinine amidohydrolase
MIRRKKIIKMFRLSEMNLKQVLEYLKENDILVLPVGSTESHGNLLPVGTDYLVAEKIAEEAGQKTNVLVAPTLCYGWTPAHLGHPGTASLTGETFIAVLKEICCSYIYHGFKKIVIVNGHRITNLAPMRIAISWLRNTTGALVVIIDPLFIASSVADKIRAYPGSMGHGGDVETSHMLYLFPDLVRMEEAVSNPAKKKDLWDLSEDFVITVETAAEYNAKSGSSGTTGDSLKGNIEKGEVFHKKLIENTVRVINDMKSMKVELNNNIPLPY